MNLSLLFQITLVNFVSKINKHSALELHRKKVKSGP